jgi:hypothetical protein
VRTSAGTWQCRLAAIAALGTSIAACATAKGPGTDEYLDERTGANITVMHQAFTFALERSTLAAHARDYVSLAAVEVDRSGQTQLYLIGYFWSTIDRRKDAAAPSSTAAVVELVADGRRIRLRPDAALPSDLRAKRQLLAPAASHFEQAAYPVSLELLRYIAGSRVLVLRLAGGSHDEDDDMDSYALWTDARPELQAFTRRVAPGG